MRWPWWVGAWLLSAVPAQAPADLSERVTAALNRARPALLDLLRTRLGGELALVCLAAVHDEVPPDDIALVRAIDRLDKTVLTGTYELSLRLMVMSGREEYPDRERAAHRDLQHLLRNQTPAGGFGYGSGGSSWDLSNTQYGVLGMRAAVSLGCEIQQIHWKRLRRATERAQRSNGGFGYRANIAATPSMTVAGIAVLEICAQHLQGRGVAAALGGRLQRGWAWMAQHAAAIGRPESSHAYYFHYGLERAAILSGVSTVGDIDWYEAGAKLLLEEQGPGGSWSPFRKSGVAVDSLNVPADAVATAFAVLFLRRQFQRRLTPLTAGGGLLTRGLPPDATEAQIACAVELDVDRGLQAVPDLLKALRSPIVARRKAAAVSIARISGEDFGLHPYRDPAESADAIKAAERWWLTEGRRGLGRR